MKIDKKELLNVFKSAVYPKRTAIPIISAYHFKNVNGSVEICTTDLDVYHKVTLKTDEQKQLKFVIDAKTLETFVKSQKTDIIDFTMDGADIFIGSSKINSEFVFDTDEYPTAENNKNKHTLSATFKLSATDVDALFTPFKSVKKHVNDTKQFSSFMAMNTIDNQIQLVYTQGYFIKQNEIFNKNNIEIPEDFALPVRFIDMINKKDQSYTFNFYVPKPSKEYYAINGVEVITETSVTLYRIDFESFPPIKTIFNQSKDDSFGQATTIKTQELKDVLTEVKASSKNKEKHCKFVFDIQKHSFTVSNDGFHDTLFDFSKRLDFQSSYSDSLTIGVNVDYLLAIIDKFHSETVFYFNRVTDPILIYSRDDSVFSTDDKGFMAILMPVSL